MDIVNSVFKRKFSMSMFKNLQLPLGEMTFTKDFVSDRRGDLYPVLAKSDDCSEKIAANRYFVDGGKAERLVGQFFPYATFEAEFCLQGGACGFGFAIPDAKAYVMRDESAITFRCGEQEERVECDAEKGSLIISCRPGAFDVYVQVNGTPKLVHTFRTAAFAKSHDQKAFINGTVSLAVSGCVEVKTARYYIDNGISLADMRPIRYENGQVMMEQGKVYFTASIRMQEEMFQGVFRWTPGLADVEICGAIFYDAGDGLWCGDVAASVLYHREKQQWLLWVCSFNHGHMLAHAAFEGDPRFGVNVVDVELITPADEKDDITVFAGFKGDEDPDFFYDAKSGKWLMAVCRLDRESRKYRYVFFESTQPFEGYTCIGMGKPGEETGGSFVKINGELHFVCGKSFSSVSDYRIYRKDSMHTAAFDFPDGGFRGWGTVIPVQQGSRTRYYWITFDRHNGSAYNWSYGNFYCFEAMEA